MRPFWTSTAGLDIFTSSAQTSCSASGNGAPENLAHHDLFKILSNRSPINYQIGPFSSSMPKRSPRSQVSEPALQYARIVQRQHVLLNSGDVESTRVFKQTMNASNQVKAPRGTTISCKGWHQEAALRMLMNNLDPEVAEKPDELIVYGGTGRAARNWHAFNAIVHSLRELENDETLLVQSGKPVGI